jgi:hypothetical protein
MDQAFSQDHVFGQEVPDFEAFLSEFGLQRIMVKGGILSVSQLVLSVIVYKVTVLEVLVYKSLQDLALARIFEQGFRRIKDIRCRPPLQELHPSLESS